MFGCEMGRDSGLPIGDALPSADGGPIAVEGVKQREYSIQPVEGTTTCLLQLETHLASCWEGVRLPRASGKSPDFPGSSPNFPRSFSATSPEVLSM